MSDTPSVKFNEDKDTTSVDEPAVHLFAKSKKAALYYANMRKKIESAQQMSIDQTHPTSGTNRVAPKEQLDVSEEKLLSDDLKPIEPRLSYSYSEQNLSRNNGNPYGDGFLKPQQALSNGHSRYASAYCPPYGSHLDVASAGRIDGSATKRLILRLQRVMGDNSEGEASELLSSSGSYTTPPNEPSLPSVQSSRPPRPVAAACHIASSDSSGSGNSERSSDHGRVKAGHCAASMLTSSYRPSPLPYVHNHKDRSYHPYRVAETSVTVPTSTVDDSEMSGRGLFDGNPLHNTASLLPNTDVLNELETCTNRHRGELTGPEKYEYDLRRAQLKASSRTSALLAGFAMVALVELQYDNDTPPALLVILGFVTTILVSVHLIALMTSTCILPHIEASGCTEDSPHKQLEFFITMSWTFSTCIGLLLFLVEIVLIFFVKFSGVHYMQGAWIMLVLLVPVFIAFGVISYKIHHRQQQHSVNRVNTKINNMEDMIKAHDHSHDFQKTIDSASPIQVV